MPLAVTGTFEAVHRKYREDVKLAQERRQARALKHGLVSFEQIDIEVIFDAMLHLGCVGVVASERLSPLHRHHAAAIFIPFLNSCPSCRICTDVPTLMHVINVIVLSIYNRLTGTRYENSTREAGAEGAA
jgi:hypothetical protein